MIILPDLIRQANELNPLPPTIVRLVGLLSKPDFHMDDAEELIRFDQALTLKLLRAANSAASASTAQIGTVREAMNRMGVSQVLALAVASGAKPFLQTSIPSYELGEGALWRHSVAAAIAAETIQSLGKISGPPETFTAALLHDVGKLVVGRFITPEISNYLLRGQETDHLSQSEAEMLLLSVHHAELGGLIAQNWKLPPCVVKGISYHHDPDQALDIICDLTYLANLLAKHIEAHLDGKPFELTILPSVLERLALKQESFNQFCPAAISRYKEMFNRYNSI